MTIQNFKVPAVWGVVIFAVAVFVEFRLTTQWGDVARLVGIYGLIVLAVRDIRGRNKEDVTTVAQRGRIERKLDDISTVVTSYLDSRATEVAEIRQETLNIAERLREDSTKRQIATDAALRDQTSEIVAKIEEGTEASKAAQMEANNVNAKLLALGHQITGVDEHTQAAYKEANNVNLKIESLNERLLKQGEQADENKAASDGQIESIKTTGEESNTILKENLVQAAATAASTAAGVASEAAATAADVATTAARVASRAAGIAAGQLDEIQDTGQRTHDIAKSVEQTIKAGKPK